MRLRFEEDLITTFANKYSFTSTESELLALRDNIQSQKYLTKLQLKLLAKWKSPRRADRIENNSENFVQEITRFSLTAGDERARIAPLTLLDGILWPTASAVLHLFHQDNYPILDFRALWSVSAEVPNQYNYNFWLEYVYFCRSLAQRNGVTMRILDRALWQYSKENQALD